MNQQVEKSIAEAKTAGKAGDRLLARSIADLLIREHPEEMKVWLLSGHLYELGEEYEPMKAALARAVEISPLEPHLYYTRGRPLYHLALFDEAARDFAKGLQLCDHHRNDYYRTELHFWHAEVLAKLGNQEAALGNLRNVPEDFVTWTDRKRTKQNLLDELKGASSS